MTILLHKPYSVKVTTKGEGEGQKYPKIVATWLIDDPFVKQVKNTQRGFRIPISSIEWIFLKRLHQKSRLYVIFFCIECRKVWDMPSPTSCCFSLDSNVNLREFLRKMQLVVFKEPVKHHQKTYSIGTNKVWKKSY